ncbi:MAG: FAD-dependent oxidoreductase [Candidatus Gracilibacteria bacterium]|nr:FAD-dependent oxidoreductase [Candidatus Gracilibacteria bacterium]
MIQKFELIKKINLTDNVYELTFKGENELDMKPGQFVTFLLDKIGGRAYSVLEKDGRNIVLLIKKWELDEGGRGGSKYICEQEIGTNLRGVGPAGHFVLKENSNNKLFIGTGTGLVPLYNQIIGAIDKELDTRLKLIFGLREIKDIFYTTELNNLKKDNSNFDYEIYLSRAESEGTKKGYVTDYLNKEIVEIYKEFYICGMPSMIDSTIEKLISLGVDETNIYFEKY